MDGWLKEDFELDQAVTGRIVAGVRQRATRRRRNRTALGSALSLCLVGILAGSFLVDGRRPSDPQAAPLVASVSAAPSGPAVAPSLRATQHSALDLSLARVENSVAVQWEGDPRAEYVVYRCSSPHFDACSVADRVRGTQWVDPVRDSGTITFYRVEPKG